LLVRFGAFSPSLHSDAGTCTTGQRWRKIPQRNRCLYLCHNNPNSARKSDSIHSEGHHDCAGSEANLLGAATLVIVDKLGVGLKIVRNNNPSLHL
jgi:hypothetical protein